MRIRSIASVLFALLFPGQAHAFALKTTADGMPVRWQQPNVELRIDRSLADRIGADETHAAAVIASEAWRGLDGVPDVRIADGEPAKYDSAKRGNGIYLLNDWPFESDQIAMTITTYTPDGVIVGVDILINGTRSFGMLHEPSNEADEVVQDGGPHDLAAVLTHEIGHALGLAHSDADAHATMWPNIRGGETHQRTLSEDDERGIEEAYAAPMKVVPTTTTACSVSQGHTQSAGLPLFALLGLAVTFARRRR